MIAKNNNKLKNNRILPELLVLIVGKYINKITVINDKDLVIYLRDYKDIKIVSFFLKNLTSFQYKILSDLTCVDLLNWDSKTSKNRFSLVYSFLSILNENRLQLKLSLKNDLNLIPSLSPIFSSSNWLEREVWDLFGIIFMSHPDLRRILTDYGFSGFPLRKDFPLVGFIELRYDDEFKRIVYELIELSQEFRVFNFLSPWDQSANSKLNLNVEYK